ncbi:MAG: hypothetical protein ACI9XO_001574 [Paraglaciecola sp.]|jgi:hypothetical protein
MEQLKQIVKKRAFLKGQYFALKNTALWSKMVGIITLLVLILVLSATNNYLFFDVLLNSSGIILLVSVISFLENKEK